LVTVAAGRFDAVALGEAFGGLPPVVFGGYRPPRLSGTATAVAG
jgi:hypothetical protein